MGTNMVVTNLRIAEPDWRQIKAVAGEMGMSVNKYINQIISKVVSNKELGILEDRKKAEIWEELPKIALMSNDKPMKLSEDDEIIYG